MISRRAMMNDEIVSKSGELLQLEKCKGSYLNSLNVFGKSKQVTTTGAQLLNPTLFDANKTVNGVTFETQKDGSILISGTSTGKATFYFGDYIDLLEDGKSYIYNSESRYGVLNIAFNDGTPNDYSNKITVDKSRMVSIKPYAQFVENALVNSKQYIFPILNEGTVIKSWEPYTGGKPSPSMDWEQPIVNAGESGSIGVEVMGKNLLTGRLYYSNYSNSKGYIENETTVVLPYRPNTETRGVAYVIPCKSGKSYTLSVTNPNKYAAVGISEYKDFDSAKSYKNVISFVRSQINEHKITYTAKTDGVLVCFLAGYWTDGNTTIHECTESELLQLEIGSEATAYEPPRTPQTLTLSTPNGLPGVPVTKDGNYTDFNGQQWICDEMDLGCEKYIQMIEVIKANDLTWKADFFGGETNRIYRYSTSAIPDLIDRLNGLSNCFRYRTSSSIKANEFVVEEIGRLRVVFETPFESIEALMEWFRQKETVFYLPKSTPIERDLTPEEIEAYKSLHTYYGTTVVTNDENSGMEVSYRKVRG